MLLKSEFHRGFVTLAATCVVVALCVGLVYGGLGLIGARKTTPGIMNPAPVPPAEHASGHLVGS
ncbi:MAG TPA: hypothetical protein V6C89_10145 [Drouetiella sp.]